MIIGSGCCDGDSFGYSTPKFRGRKIRFPKKSMTKEDKGKKHKVIDDLFGINLKDLDNNFDDIDNKKIGEGEQDFIDYVKKMNVLLGSYDPFMPIYRMSGVNKNA